MPRLLRYQCAGAMYHVNIGAVEGLPLFADDVDRESFVWTLGTTVDRCRLQLMQWCIVTTHFHLLFETLDDNIADAMCRLNGLYARSYNGRRARKGHVFKERYFARVIQTRTQLLRTAAYIARNPEKAGLCERPESWRWGSYASTLRDGRPWPANAAGRLLNEFHRDPLVARELFRRLTNSDEALELDE